MLNRGLFIGIIFGEQNKKEIIDIYINCNTVCTGKNIPFCFGVHSH